MGNSDGEKEQQEENLGKLGPFVEEADHATYRLNIYPVNV